MSKDWLASSWTGELMGTGRWAVCAGMKKLLGGFAAAEGAGGTKGGSIVDAVLQIEDESMLR